ncbi:TPA: hypothetical protein QB404_000753 [Pasteurella multocida]|nr:hypothetical protein [Pasteurella multocida]HDR1359517.1 hypothetical protein [Pasteurella multocida]
MKEIDFTFDRGDDEFIVFNAKHKCKPVDVTSANFSMRVKPYEQKGAVIELTSANGAITVKDRSHIVIKASKEITETMTAHKYAYNLRVTTADGLVKTLVGGYITMRKGV